MGLAGLNRTRALQAEQVLSHLQESFLSNEIINMVFFYRFGFNKWRDPMRPTQILAKICKEEGLDGPHYSTGRVRIDNKVFGATSQVLEESGMFWQFNNSYRTSLSEVFLSVTLDRYELCFGWVHVLASLPGLFSSWRSCLIDNNHLKAWPSREKRKANRPR